jgi:hypothetical protein
LRRKHLRIDTRTAARERSPDAHRGGDTDREERVERQYGCVCDVCDRSSTRSLDAAESARASERRCGPANAGGVGTTPTTVGSACAVQIRGSPFAAKSHPPSCRERVAGSCVESPIGGEPGEAFVVSDVVGVALQELARERWRVYAAERLVLGRITPVRTRHCGYSATARAGRRGAIAIVVEPPSR